jgi:hypothetical protein
MILLRIKKKETFGSFFKKNILLQKNAVSCKFLDEFQYTTNFKFF